MEEITKVRLEFSDHPMWLQIRETLQRHREEILHLSDLYAETQTEFTRIQDQISQKNPAVPLELKNMVVAAFVLLFTIIYLLK